MKGDTYTVLFETGKIEEVYALCEKSATILAQARQIDRGNNWTVASIRKQD